MLTTGSTVYARIVATNDIGDSIQSSISNGVIITYSYVPNAPISLTRDSLTTTTTQIGLLWTAGSSNGGQAILDYRIWYD
jgi:hypothetical protein